jgi:hypothetical protein
LLGGRFLTLATGAGAAAPIVISTVHAVQYRWEPTDDKAIIATRAWDVLTSHTPLVGQFSTVSEVTGHATYSPGPMLYWLLALPARVGGPLSMAVTMGVLNTLAVLASVALARRRGGRPLMFAAAVAIGLMCMSLAGETFHDTWNSSAPLFPFLLLIFLCWSLACGDHRLLAVTVLLASFVVQAHLSYVAPTAGLIGIGLAGLAVSVIARRRGPDPDRARAVGGWSLARWALAALVVVAICWTPTVVDQASHSHGNVSRLVEVARSPQPLLGARIGWRAVVRAVGLPPWWLYTPTTRWDRYQDVLVKPDAARTAVAIALLAALGVVAVVALVRRRGDVAAAALIGLALSASAGVVAARTPTIPNLASTVGYTLWWASHVGMWVWLVAAWSAWLALRWALEPQLARLWPPRAETRRRRIAAVAPVLLSVLGVGAAGVAGVVVAGAELPDQHLALYRPIATIAARLERAIPSSETVRMDGRLDPRSLPIKAAIRYHLALHGVRVLATGSYYRSGYWYEPLNRPYNMTLYLSNHARAPTRWAVLVVRVAFTEVGRHRLYVWISPRAPSAVNALRAPGRSARTRRPRSP